MIFAGPPKKFIQCLNACVGGLNLIPPDEWEGNLPARPYKGRNDQWVIGRGDKYFAVTADDQGRERFSLTPTGQLSIYIRVKRHQNSRTKQEESELAEYSWRSRISPRAMLVSLPCDTTSTQVTQRPRVLTGTRS